MIDPSEQGTSSAVAPEQTINPSAQGTPSVAAFQEFTTNKSTKKFTLILVLINSTAEYIPLAGSSSRHNSDCFFQPKARDCLETSKPSDLVDLHYSYLSLTDSLPSFRNKTPPLAFSLSPSTFLMMKGKKQAPHWC